MVFAIEVTSFCDATRCSSESTESMLGKAMRVCECLSLSAGIIYRAFWPMASGAMDPILRRCFGILVELVCGTNLGSDTRRRDFIVKDIETCYINM